MVFNLETFLFGAVVVLVLLIFAVDQIQKANRELDEFFNTFKDWKE